MKSLDQIIRYTSHCRFPDEDWQRVLDECRRVFGGGKIHRAQQPISTSTYGQFEEWLDNGFGSGDMVAYGRMIGIVGSATPERTYLAAYTDFEGNLHAKNMDVMEPHRLRPLNDGERRELRRLMFEKGVDYSVRSGLVSKVYTPKENSYAVFGSDDKGNNNVGMYLGSEGCKYHFSAFVQNGEILMDYWVDSDYAPLKPAGDSDIQRFHRILSKAGWSYNARVNKFVKQTKRGCSNTYWYLNDRFQIVMDKDNGSERHDARFKAGNYFTDLAFALEFMKAVQKMSKGKP